MRFIQPIRSLQLSRARVALVAAALTTLCAFAPADDAPSAPPASEPAAQTQETLNRQLQVMLTHAELTGHFTAGTDATAPQADRYVIESARPLSGDLWVLSTRMQFGTHDTTLPLVVPIKWAGDTPVISVTDLSILGIGTYTARVVLYRDHYAGTWSGAKHGGAMWGEIHHLSATQPTTAPTEP